MKKIKIAIAGSNGRMGRTLLENVLQSDDLALHAALEHSNSALIGKDAGEFFGMACGIKISADVAAALQGADVLIDFTRPEGTLNHHVHAVLTANIKVMQRAFGAGKIDQHIRALQRRCHICTDFYATGHAKKFSGILANKRAVAVLQRSMQREVI